MRAVRFAGLLVACALLVPAGAAAANADLAVAMTDSPDPVAKGELLTYTITVTNLGPATAGEVFVRDSVPNRADYVSVTSSQGSCAIQGKKVTCSLGSVAFSEYTPTAPGATVTLVVRPNKIGKMYNTATVAVGKGDTDPKPGNNSVKVRTTVIAPPGPAPTCGGQPATIVGTGGADTLLGTDGPDVIKARGGNDAIRAIRANDIVCAGGGDDVVKGGGGNDRLKGGAGADLIKGGNGNDALDGGPGRDRCIGGPGRNTKRSC